MTAEPQFHRCVYPIYVAEIKKGMMRTIASSCLPFHAGFGQRRLPLQNRARLLTKPARSDEVPLVDHYAEVEDPVILQCAANSAKLRVRLHVTAPDRVPINPDRADIDILMYSNV